jgi:hypothetical protein
VLWSVLDMGGEEEEGGGSKKSLPKDDTSDLKNESELLGAIVERTGSMRGYGEYARVRRVCDGTGGMRWYGWYARTCDDMGSTG